MRGREWGWDERIDATVDLPVAIEPVSPIMSIMRTVQSALCLWWRMENENEVGWLHSGVIFGMYGYGDMYILRTDMCYLHSSRRPSRLWGPPVPCRPNYVL